MSRDNEQEEDEHSRSSIEKIADFFSHLAFGESDAAVDSKDTSTSGKKEKRYQKVSERNSVKYAKKLCLK